MTRAEQEAFEKWMDGIGILAMSDFMRETFQAAFLAGYRAGFEAQHCEVDDV
jgi:hypothetical protein